MSSNTPRTDEAENNSMGWVTAEFARQLEIENFENETRVSYWKKMFFDCQKLLIDMTADRDAVQQRASKSMDNARALLRNAHERAERAEAQLIRKSLAQPEQEPVAWELRAGKTDRVLIEITNNPRRAHDWKASLEEVVPLFTTPPQRTWIGLTEEERDHFEGLHLYAARNQVEAWIEGVPAFIYAIEAKLREKNGC